jgi:hypothetical protein
MAPTDDLVKFDAMLQSFTNIANVLYLLKQDRIC